MTKCREINNVSRHREDHEEPRYHRPYETNLTWQNQIYLPKTRGPYETNVLTKPSATSRYHQCPHENMIALDNSWYHQVSQRLEILWCLMMLAPNLLTAWAHKCQVQKTCFLQKIKIDNRSCLMTWHWRDV